MVNPAELEQTIADAFRTAIAPVAQNLEALQLKLENDNGNFRTHPFNLPALLTFKPPTAFSGSIGDSFSEWKEKLNRYLTLQGVSDTEDEYRKAFLENCLSGAALASYRELKNSANPPDTYDMILTELSQLFPEGKDSDIHRQIIFDRRQKPTESVIKYIDSLYKLARLAYPGLNETSRKDIVMPIFLRGLIPKIREQTKFKSFETIEEAIKSSQYIENQLFKQDIFVASNSINTITNFRNQSAMKPQMTKPCAVCERTNHTTDECRFNGQKYRGGASANVCCEICGKSNHATAECRAPCGNCGGRGHKTRLCKKPKRAAQRPADQQTRRPPQSNANYRQYGNQNEVNNSNKYQHRNYPNQNGNNHVNTINSVDLEDESLYIKNLATNNNDINHSVAAISANTLCCKSCSGNENAHQNGVISATCTCRFCPNHAPMLLRAMGISDISNEQPRGNVAANHTASMPAIQLAPVQAASSQAAPPNNPTKEPSVIEADLAGYKIPKRVFSSRVINANGSGYGSGPSTIPKHTYAQDDIPPPATYSDGTIDIHMSDGQELDLGELRIKEKELVAELLHGPVENTTEVAGKLDKVHLKIQAKGKNTTLPTLPKFVNATNSDEYSTESGKTNIIQNLLPSSQAANSRWCTATNTVAPEAAKRAPAAVQHYKYHKAAAAVAERDKSLSILFVLLTQLVYCTGAQDSKIFQTCGSSKSGHALNIPKNISCIFPRNLSERPKEVNIILSVPRQYPEKASAIKCTQKQRKVCTYTSLFGAKSILFDETEIKHTDMLECKRTFETKTYKERSLKQSQTGIWATNNEIKIDFIWCCKMHCVTVSNYLIEEGYVATWNGRTISSDLGNLGGCLPSAGRCTSPDGTIIWDGKNMTEVCPYTEKGKYTAKSSPPFLVVDSLQAAFMIKTTVNNTCLSPKAAYLTHQGVKKQQNAPLLGFEPCKLDKVVVRSLPH